MYTVHVLYDYNAYFYKYKYLLQYCKYLLSNKHTYGLHVIEQLIEVYTFPARAISKIILERLVLSDKVCWMLERSWNVSLLLVTASFSSKKREPLSLWNK